MKKEFTRKELYLIHETFDKMCRSYIDDGDAYGTVETLNVINVVRNHLQLKEYENSVHFMLSMGNERMDDTSKRRLLYSEIKAAEAMDTWTKSTETDPTPDLLSAIEACMEEKKANEGSNVTQVLAHRLLVINHLVILATEKYEYELDYLYKLRCSAMTLATTYPISVQERFPNDILSDKDKEKLVSFFIKKGLKIPDDLKRFAPKE